MAFCSSLSQITATILTMMKGSSSAMCASVKWTAKTWTAAHMILSAAAELYLNYNYITLRLLSLTGHNTHSDPPPQKLNLSSGSDAGLCGNTVFIS